MSGNSSSGDAKFTLSGYAQAVLTTGTKHPPYDWQYKSFVTGRGLMCVTTE